MTDHGEIQRWADSNQFHATPMQSVEPRVHLLWMTPDPLGAIAAMCRMYKGIPTYNLTDITDDERKEYFNDAMATHLKAPLEAVKFHFFIEGVDRAFTHQMVRQRTAVYAQESLRFAVKDNLASETTLPPSLAGTHSYDVSNQDEHEGSSQRMRNTWDTTMDIIQDAYTSLVDGGMPAEEARGLLPHATATRLNYVTDLRALSDHAGNRLCTQAQFHWRIVFAGIVNAIKDYSRPEYDDTTNPYADAQDEYWYDGVGWQYELMAKSNLFRPVCYQVGRCPFQASFDRGCTIRERADKGEFDKINAAEWLLDPSAARE